MKPISPENSTLGFVGVGYMGRPIAQRLLEFAFKLTAYDRERSKAEQLVRYGGTVAESVAELSSSCRAFRAMKLSWTFIEGLTAFSPMRIAARGSLT